MNLIQIKYFLEVAECLNFTAAAARLFVSQQCVSKQVAKLEREIGVRLFERSTAKVALTDAGKLLQGECWSAAIRRWSVPGRCRTRGGPPSASAFWSCAAWWTLCCPG